MSYIRQHQLLEKLGDVERLYSGLFPTKGRRYTVKWTSNGSAGNGEARPYLYTWVNFADGESEKYSVEAGKVITRKGGAKQQRVYLCPIGKNSEAEMSYYKAANETIILKIEDLREALEKQIRVIGRHYNLMKIKNYGMSDEALTDKIEEELSKRYPVLFNKGIKELEEIEKLIKKDKSAKELMMLFKERNEKEKELKRVEKEKEKQLKKQAKKGL